MIYKFIDKKGTFVVRDPQKYKCYFPLVDRDGKILSSISANLSGDIKQDNEHFLTPPASVEDIRSNLLCRRDFFIASGKSYLRMSIPHHGDTLEAGLLYHKITKKLNSLKIEILNFVPYNLGVEVMWVKVKNIGRATKEIIPTSFVPLYGRSEKNLRDHRHVSSLLNRISLDRYGIFLKPTMIFDEKGHTLNKDIYYAFGCQGNGKAPVGQFPTLDYFYGHGDLLYPDAVLKNVRPVVKYKDEFDGKEASAAFRFAKKTLESGQEADYFVILGIGQDKQKIKDVFFGLNSLTKVKSRLEETKKYWQNYLSGLNIDFGDMDLNNWLLWVRFQPTLRRVFGCSFLPHFDYGKGGRGWRDLWQDALALLLTEPDKAKEAILDSFKGVRSDGSNATIITKEGGFIADRNKISRVWMDHGVWPYLTLKLYINKTGDLGILLRGCEYFRDHQLNRAKEIDTDFRQTDYLLRSNNKRVYKGSILEHLLVQNLVQFFNVGSHNIIRLENADWNDGLDMAAGKGESVAFSFMYAHNLKGLCDFLRELKKKYKTVTILKELSLLLDLKNRPIDYADYRAKQKRLEEYFSKTKNISGQLIKVDIDELILDLKAKSAHLSDWLRKREWLGNIFNGYYDNKGKRVEAKFGIMLQSQVFAIMSGIPTKEQIRKTWASIKKHLYDKGLYGFRLNTDFGRPLLDFGRAFGFSYGDKENGAFFSHMNVMLANALYRQGFVKEGFEVISSIYKMAISPKSNIYPALPEYFNSQGKGMYLYLTGSASWYIYTLIEEVFGIKFALGDILLEPKLAPGNFSGKEKIKVSLKILNKPVDIQYIKLASKNEALQIKRIILGKQRILVPFGKAIIKKEFLASKGNSIKVYLQ